MSANKLQVRTTRLKCLRLVRILSSLFVGLLLGASTVRAGASHQSYWHTRGSQVLDSDENEVRISGVNWYGFEAGNGVPYGLQVQDYHVVLNTVKALGYNTIRLPFSNEMVESPVIPSNVSFSSSGVAINKDLQGLNSLQIMDKIVAYADLLGVHIILDNHRSSATGAAESLWYSTAYPESAWINDWKALALRYLGNPTVIGVDLRNEPYGACWGCGPPAAGNPDIDWQAAAERGGNAVQSVNPKLIVFVEGTATYGSDWYWDGGNLEGVRDYPVVLNTPNQLVYSAHDYGPNLYRQSWFNSNTTPSSLDAIFTKYWGYIAQQNIAPVWVGEFGTTNAATDIMSTVAGSQGQWFQTLVAYLQANLSIGWTYWALDGEDVYGLLDSNYDSTPASAAKQQALASIQSTVTGGTLSAGLLYMPITPCRVADTRNAVGPFGAPSIAAGGTRSLVVPGSSCDIPPIAAAYSLNVTVVPHGPLSYITVWPTGQAQPVVSLLNSDDGRVKANAAIVPAGANGAISFFATNETELVVDINGYFVSSAAITGLAFYSVTPCRVADTRFPLGTLGLPSLTGTQPRSLSILASNCGLPDSPAPTAYSLNFTAIPQKSAGLSYLATWPTGQVQPVVSTLNAPTGAVTANAALLTAGTEGAISVFATDNSDLAVDVNGYFAPPLSNGLLFYPTSPCRVLDTRNSGSGQPFSGTLFVSVGGSCGVPSNASAVVGNFTVVPKAALSYLSLWPYGFTLPVVSTLNASDGTVTSNMAIVPMSGGAINVFATNGTQLILDVTGYFAP